MEGLRSFLSWLSWILEWVALAALGCLGFALDVELSTGEASRRLFLQRAIEWCHAHATEAGVFLAVFILLVRFFRWICREKSEEAEIVDRLISDALEKFRRSVFRDIPENEPHDYNRVTVFRHHKLLWRVYPFRGIGNPWGWGRWPWSGWLAVAYRSGHVTQAGGAIFLAPDDPNDTEGVAGMGWRCDACRVGGEGDRLPDLGDVEYVGFFRRYWFQLQKHFGRGRNSHAARFLETSERVEMYSKRTLCSESFVWRRIKRGRLNPTSILAIQLRDSRNAAWGVLVMDSCNGIECIDTNEKAFRMAFTTLTKELQRLQVLQ